MQKCSPKTSNNRLSEKPKSEAGEASSSVTPAPRPVCRVLSTPPLGIAMHFATCLEGCQSCQSARWPPGWAARVGAIVISTSKLLSPTNCFPEVPWHPSARPPLFATPTIRRRKRRRRKTTNNTERSFWIWLLRSQPRYCKSLQR